LGILLVALVMASLSGCCGSVPAPTPTGNVTQPAPVKATATAQAAASGKIAVPAQQWYTAALSEAQGWKSDVFLYNIEGNNNEYPAKLPVDGKCREWSYGFISPSAKEMHTVIIRDGSVLRTDNVSVATGGAWEKILTGVNYRIDQWTIDSPAATKAANEQYQKMNGSQPAGEVMYTLLQDYNPPDKFQLTWVVTYDPSARLNNPSATITVVRVNADTGSVLS
jgi:hypothetical protein